MSNLEEIKQSSRYLRGTLNQELSEDSDRFDDDSIQLLKFHGTYQQDDRDLRIERRNEGKDRAFMMMIRSKVPNGVVTPEQYLAQDNAADTLGNGTIRITSRQDFQLHGVLKSDIKTCIQQLNRSGMTTWGACGDVVRNVIGPAAPLKTPSHIDAEKLAFELTDAFGAKSNAYNEIWLDGEKVASNETEPLYDEAYLPRKFKIGIAIPPQNDVDIYTHDVGLVPHEEDGAVEGYTVIAGGGFGMSHGKKNTYPRLGTPLFYVARQHVVDVVKTIVCVQRDNGNREDRKQARMKYLIDSKGWDWFKKEVMSRLDTSVETLPPKSMHWTSVSDMYGWHEDGDGSLFCCIWIPEGRIQDGKDGNYKTAFRELTEKYQFPIRLTPNCNIIFHDIDPAQKGDFNQLLKTNGIRPADKLTEARRLGMACVSMPTCGLGLAESERVFQDVLDKIDEVLRDLGLEQEPILIRMTGCPNGCVRPYNADFAFVGKSPKKYVFFVGGSKSGERLASVQNKMVDEDEIPDLIRGYLEDFVTHRQEGESFSDYWGRTHPSEGVTPEQFH